MKNMNDKKNLVFKIIYKTLRALSVIPFLFVNASFVSACSTMNLLDSENIFGDYPSSSAAGFLRELFNVDIVRVCFVSFVILFALSVVFKIIYKKRTADRERKNDKITPVLKFLDAAVLVYLADSIMFNAEEMEPFSFGFFGLAGLIVFSVAFVVLTVVIAVRRGNDT